MNITITKTQFELIKEPNTLKFKAQGFKTFIFLYLKKFKYFKRACKENKKV